MKLKTRISPRKSLEKAGATSSKEAGRREKPVFAPQITYQKRYFSLSRKILDGDDKKPESSEKYESKALIPAEDVAKYSSSWERYREKLKIKMDSFFDEYYQKLYQLNREELQRKVENICDERLKKETELLKEKIINDISSELSKQAVAHIETSKNQLNENSAAVIENFEKVTKAEREKQLKTFSETCEEIKDKIIALAESRVEKYIKDSREKYFMHVNNHTARSKEIYSEDINSLSEEELRRFSESIKSSFDQKMKTYRKVVEDEMKSVADIGVDSFKSQIKKLNEERFSEFDQRIDALVSEKSQAFQEDLSGKVEDVSVHVDSMLRKKYFTLARDAADMVVAKVNKVSENIDQVYNKKTEFFSENMRRVYEGNRESLAKVTEAMGQEFYDKYKVNAEGYEKKYREQAEEFSNKYREEAEEVKKHALDDIKTGLGMVTKRYIFYILGFFVLIFLLDLAYTYLWKDEEIEDFLDKLIYLDDFQGRIRFDRSQKKSDQQENALLLIQSILDRLPTYILAKLSLRLLPFMFFNPHFPAAGDLFFSMHMLLQYEPKIALQAIAHIEETNYMAVYAVYADEAKFVEAYANFQLGDDQTAIEILDRLINSNLHKRIRVNNDKNDLARYQLLKAKIVTNTNEVEELLGKVANGDFDNRYKIIANRQLGLLSLKNDKREEARHHFEEMYRRIDMFKKTQEKQFNLSFHDRNRNMQTFIDHVLVEEMDENFKNASVQFGDKKKFVKTLTTNREYAQMVYISESPLPAKSNNVLKDWNQISLKRHLKDQGFDIFAFANIGKNELVIVFNYNKPLGKALQEPVSNSILKTPELVLQAINDVRKTIDENKLNAHTKITFTGYGYGAALSEALLSQFLNDENLGSQVSSITFNSFGSASLIKQLCDIKPLTQKDISNQAITFLPRPDQHNTEKEHAASIMQLDTNIASRGMGDHPFIKPVKAWFTYCVGLGARVKKTFTMAEIIAMMDEFETHPVSFCPVTIYRWPHGKDEIFQYAWYEYLASTRNATLADPKLELDYHDQYKLNRVYSSKPYSISQASFKTLSEETKQYLRAYVHTLGKIDQKADRNILEFSVRGDKIDVYSVSMMEFVHYVEQRIRHLKSKSINMNDYREFYLTSSNNQARYYFFSGKKHKDENDEELQHFSTLGVR